MIFFTSDLHFNHINILAYQRGALFTDVDNMNDEIRVRWNRTVGPEDTVYILGDAVMGKRAESLPLLDLLNGKKHLISGNHDYCHPGTKEKVRVKWTPEYEKYFESIQTELVMDIAGNKVLLSHFPATLDHTDEVRYTDYRPVYDGIIMHGHLHCEEIFVEPDHIHVGIDADYTDYGVERYSPIPLETIEQIVTELHWIQPA